LAADTRDPAKRITVLKMLADEMTKLRKGPGEIAERLPTAHGRVEQHR
jgi:hypothetical protein